MNCPMTLFQKIGGEGAVRAVVARLYDKILDDPLLQPFFQNVDVERLRRSQAAFVGMAFGSTHHYTGKNVREAHRALLERGLNDVHFNAVAVHLKSAMEEAGVPENMIIEALAIVETTRTHVLNR